MQTFHKFKGYVKNVLRLYVVLCVIAGCQDEPVTDSLDCTKLGVTCAAGAECDPKTMKCRCSAGADLCACIHHGDCLSEICDQYTEMPTPTRSYSERIGVCIPSKKVVYVGGMSPCQLSQEPGTQDCPFLSLPDAISSKPPVSGNSQWIRLRGQSAYYSLPKLPYPTNVQMDCDSSKLARLFIYGSGLEEKLPTGIILEAPLEIPQGSQRAPLEVILDGVDINLTPRGIVCTGDINQPNCMKLTLHRSFLHGGNGMALFFSSLQS